MDQQIAAQHQASITPYVSPKSGLIKVAQTYIATKGYKTDALLQFLSDGSHIENWCEVDNLVRLFDGRVSDAGRQAMRKRLTTAYHDFRERNRLLMRRYNNAGSIIAVKLFDFRSEADKLHIKEELEARQIRNQDSREVLDKSAALADIVLQWDIPFEEES